MTKKRVVVAMSGGVDSSVVAAMLHEQGYEVVGITLQLFDYGDAVSANQKTCCASKDVSDAGKVAEKIGFQHYVLNYESVFKNEVIDDFIDSYTKGFTPIPCVKCNQTVKFRDLYSIAKKLGAEFLATGHYVRKIDGIHGAEMHIGIDKTKDQSYFLFQTTKEQLEFLRFPLGGLAKTETRELALKYGLEVHSKPDSQNICFVPNGNYASVIEKYRPGSLDKGDIVEIASGAVIGEHNGTINFTLGQRRGLGVSGESPLYVVKIDPQTNTVFVGEEKFLYHAKFEIENTNWLLNKNEELPHNLMARVRSSQVEIPCKIEENTITLFEPSKLICPGQAAVLYDGERMLGGGFIKKILD